MVFPSGDQEGYFSWTFVVRVMFLGSPFSDGSVIISPLKSNTTRDPVGEMSTLRI